MLVIFPISWNKALGSFVSQWRVWNYWQDSKQLPGSQHTFASLNVFRWFVESPGYGNKPRRIRVVPRRRNQPILLGMFLLVLKRNSRYSEPLGARPTDLFLARRHWTVLQHCLEYQELGFTVCASHRIFYTYSNFGPLLLRNHPSAQYCALKNNPTTI